MKKWIALLLALVMCLSLCACGSKRDDADDDDDERDEQVEETAEPAITTESQAISAVKNDGYSDYNITAQAIARKLGFNQFYDPDYGVCEAEQNSDGSWSVTLNGSMSGYTDEYHSEFEKMKFKVTAEVSPDGEVSSTSVVKVY